jgi:hypothetical protein
MFIAIKNISLSAGFEPANLGTNGKQYNHYTTESDYNNDTYYRVLKWSIAVKPKMCPTFSVTFRGI